MDYVYDFAHVINLTRSTVTAASPEGGFLMPLTSGSAANRGNAGWRHQRPAGASGYAVLRRFTMNELVD